jgi:hypothetical protein
MNGFTSPTYTLVADNAPDVNAKQYAVTAVGGTQPGVSIHTLSSPFFISAWKPKVYAVLGKPNPVTGLITNVPNNEFKVVTQKGVTPAAGQPVKKMTIRTIVDVPAGADTYDWANIRAALSAHIGALSSAGQGFGDTVIQGLL